MGSSIVVLAALARKEFYILDVLEHSKLTEGITRHPVTKSNLNWIEHQCKAFIKHMTKG